MDLETVILSEVGQRKTNITWYHFHVKSKKLDTNKLYLQNIDRLTDLQNEFIVTRSLRYTCCLADPPHSTNCLAVHNVHTVH